MTGNNFGGKEIVKPVFDESNNCKRRFTNVKSERFCNKSLKFLSKLINKVYHELEIALQKESR
jgi:hypothetical protein